MIVATEQDCAAQVFICFVLGLDARDTHFLHLPRRISHLRARCFGCRSDRRASCLELGIQREVPEAGIARR